MVFQSQCNRILYKCLLIHAQWTFVFIFWNPFFKRNSSQLDGLKLREIPINVIASFFQSKTEKKTVLTFSINQVNPSCTAKSWSSQAWFLWQSNQKTQSIFCERVGSWLLKVKVSLQDVCELCVWQRFVIDSSGGSSGVQALSPVAYILISLVLLGIFRVECKGKQSHSIYNTSHFLKLYVQAKKCLFSETK